VTDAGAAAVEAYLARQTPEQEALLREVRARVLALVPDATDAISYGFPALKVGGKPLVWYAGWKRHCSLYPVGPGFIAARPELGGYGHSDKGALHFSATQPLPEGLLDDLVRERLAEVAPDRR
jgi:uncharacterized protein YdhG (YjbR/CyaY superfamily)